MKKFFLLLWFIPNVFLSAQTPVVTWELIPDKARAFAGKDVRMQFIGHIEEGWHVYAMGSPAGRPLSVKFTKLPPFFTLKGGFQQKGEAKKYDPNFESDVLQWDKTANVDGVLEISPDAPSGTHAVTAEVAYMACNDRLCLPVKKILLMTNVDVGSITKAENTVRTEIATDLSKKNVRDSVVTKPSAPDIIWNWQAANTSVARGGLLQVDFRAAIPKDWKMYTPDSPAGNPLRLKMSTPSGIKVEGALRPTGAHEVYDAVFKSKVRQWTNEANFTALLRIPNDAKGEVILDGKMLYMICNASVCVPRQSDFSVSIPVTASKGAKLEALPEGDHQGGIAATDALKQATSGGLWAFLLLAIGAALAA